jgi:Ankyrin repeats (3 copies)
VATNDGFTALQLAAADSSVDVMRLLLATPSIDVNAKSERERIATLHVAAVRGNASLVRLLLRADGVDVDALRNDGCSPMCAAARHGHKSAVKLPAVQPRVRQFCRRQCKVAALASRAHIVELLSRIDAWRVGKSSLLLLCYEAMARSSSEQVVDMAPVPDVTVHECRDGSR